MKKGLLLHTQMFSQYSGTVLWLGLAATILLSTAVNANESLDESKRRLVESEDIVPTEVVSVPVTTEVVVDLGTIRIAPTDRVAKWISQVNEEHENEDRRRLKGPKGKGHGPHKGHHGTTNASESEDPTLEEMRNGARSMEEIRFQELLDMSPYEWEHSVDISRVSVEKVCEHYRKADVDTIFSRNQMGAEIPQDDDFESHDGIVVVVQKASLKALLYAQSCDMVNIEQNGLIDIVLEVNHTDTTRVTYRVQCKSEEEDCRVVAMGCTGDEQICNIKVSDDMGGDVDVRRRRLLAPLIMFIIEYGCGDPPCVEAPKEGDCFAADTPVYVQGRGVTEMGDLVSGDYVRSLNEKTGEAFWDRVVLNFHKDQNLVSPLVDICADDDCYRLTPTHLIVVNGQPVVASSVKVGDVLSGEGATYNVTSVGFSDGVVVNPLTSRAHILACNDAECSKSVLMTTVSVGELEMAQWASMFKVVSYLFPAQTQESDLLEWITDTTAQVGKRMPGFLAVILAAVVDVTAGLGFMLYFALTYSQLTIFSTIAGAMVWLSGPVFKNKAQRS